MPTYLTLHGATYHFRYFVPESLQPAIGRKVIKISLKIGRKRLATRKARELAFAVKKTLERVKESESMGQHKVRESLRSYLKYIVEIGDMLRAAPVKIENDAELAQFFLNEM